MNQCPVCGKAGVLDGASQCPQCNADLECFQLLDDLHEHSTDNKITTVEANKTHTGFFSVFFITLFITLIIIVLFILQTFYFQYIIAQQQTKLTHYFSEQQSEQLSKYNNHGINSSINIKQIDGINNKISALEQTLTQIEDAINRLASQKNDLTQTNNQSVYSEQLASIITKLDSKLSQLSTNTTNKTTNKKRHQPEDVINDPIKQNTIPQLISYRSKETDTLWSISKHFYGKGIYYPVILKMNPDLTIYNHASYGKIKIIKEKSQLMKIYNQLRAAENE